jgi:AGCS family alanine or glycine:cation symporter
VFRGALRRDVTGGKTGDITPFQALTVALSATLGNGNVAGVATAIAIGGPGAAFWMWLVAPVGMATKYAECALAVRYRNVGDDGRVIGGPMSYLADGLGLRRLAVFFAVAAVFGGLGAGNMTQANSAALVLFSHFGVPKAASGVAMAILLWLVVVGGIKRIAVSAERLVPAMTLAYLASAFVLLALHWREVPQALTLIVTNAFTGTAAAGGFAGASLARAAAYGFRRGVVSSEAGVGSAAIAHASARAEPHQQGVIAMMGVLIDTLVVSSTTALVIVSTGTWSSGLISSEMTAEAFRDLPGGALVVAGVSVVFGFTTMLGWAYYTEQAVRYVLGAVAARPWQVVYCVLAAFGAVFEVKPLWDWSDIFFGLMVFPNIIGLVSLRRVVREMSRPVAHRHPPS